MAEKQISERGYDSDGINGIKKRDRQFDLLGNRIEKIKNEMVSTNDCFDYVLKEINSENENINRLLLWNQKRINLLNELGEKCKKLNNQLLMSYEELFSLIQCNNNLNKIKLYF